MRADEYRRMADLQGRHWWFRAKRRVVREAVRVSAKDLSPPPGESDGERPVGRVLDVGCGTGSMADVEREWGTVVAMDAHLPALAFLDVADRVTGSASALPFADRSFRAVGCFDVLYHRGIPSVEAALREIHRVCQPGGFLVVTDSAFPFLRGPHDDAVHGARRFRLGELNRMLHETGFRVLHASYFHTVLFPAATVVRLTERMLAGASRRGRTDDDGATAHSDLAPVPRWLNAALEAIYRVEAPLAARFRLPFGLSLMTIAQRTADAERRIPNG